MLHFIALVLDPSNPRAKSASSALLHRIQSTSRAWQLALSTDHICVLCASDRPTAYAFHTLQDGAGVILGRLFPRAGVSFDVKAKALDKPSTDELVKTRGRALLERYWGSYVSFIRDLNGQVCVVRDPTGGIPCFYCRQDAMTVFFSHPEDCLSTCAITPSIDWDHLAAFLHNHRLVSRSTGFQQIKQVLAGECITTTANSSHSAFYWHPVDFCTSDVIEDPREAASSLANVTRSVIHGLASRYPKVLLELSGGLDSAIVLACLAEVYETSQITCLNFHTETPDGDEREFARLAAKFHGCELVEATLPSPARSLQRRLMSVNPVSPVFTGVEPDEEKAISPLIVEREINAIFTGQGGDHLFQQNKSNLIAAEYLHRHGLRTQAIRAVLDTACMTRNSAWSVLKDAIVHGLLGRPFDSVEGPSCSFVHADFNNSLNVVHPWVEDSRDLPAAKIKHIVNVLDCQVLGYLQNDREADLANSLISQPLIEHCLRIPTYVLIYGGQERGLTRTAFSERIPQQILGRRTKGATGSYRHRLVVNNLQFIRDYLLDGCLVQQGILAKTLLEAALQEDTLVRGTQFRAFMTAVRAEAWTRNALPLSHRAVAA